MHLTDRYIAALKPAPGKPVEIVDAEGAKVRKIRYPRVEVADDDPKGLYVRVTEKGAKSWMVRYRRVDGRGAKLTLGPYPAIGLAEARRRAKEALGDVAAQKDPAAEKAAQRRAAKHGRSSKPQTLAALWEIYKRDYLPKKRQRTRDGQEWLWKKHLAPRLGNEPLSTFDRATARLALKAIGEKRPTTANRCLALLRHMLNSALADELITATPLAQMGALFEEKSRERVLADDEIEALWKAIAKAPTNLELKVSARMCSALRFLMFTTARAGEVCGLHLSEIDRSARSWTIPAERSKSKRAHVIPLSPAAWEELLDCWGADPNKWTGYAFPHQRSTAEAPRPIDRHSLTRAMADIVGICKVADETLVRATPHDARRTAATMMASERIGVAPHVVSAVLGHASEGVKVTRVYNRHRYDKEKRQALEAWALLLQEIVNGGNRASNVVQLKEIAS